MKWFVRGDIDGFFGLALDNLIQLLLIDSLCRIVLGFPPELIYGRVLPGAAVSLVLGNLYYARQAKQLGDREGRSDVCALPYGINTVSLFAFVFLVMLPAKLAAEAAGAKDPSLVAWQAGLFACLGSGLIELTGAFVAEKIRRATPRAALLSTLAGIALGFISLGFLLRMFANPVVGLTTFAIVMVTYFAKVRFKGKLPGGLIAVMVGTLLAWQIGLMDASSIPRFSGIQLPVPVIGDLLGSINAEMFAAFASVILPMGLFNVLGSLQNIESAEAAGDSYETMPSLAVNGIGSIAGAFFGSCFPTTIYIGHPGWKGLGARAGYSVLNAVFISIICFTGTLAHIAWAVPIDAGIAIVLWIGIIITSQAFQAIPKNHAPAAVIGVLPGLAAWGVLMAKSGLRAAGIGTPGGLPFSQGLIARFHMSDTWIDGGFALEQGFLFTSMILAASTVAVIERDFLKAALWCGIAAILSATGLMHAYQWTPGDTALLLEPAWPWVFGYTLMGLCFAAAKWITVPVEGAGHH